MFLFFNPTSDNFSIEPTSLIEFLIGTITYSKQIRVFQILDTDARLVQISFK